MPFHLPRRDSSESGPRRTYRQPAMLIPGVILALICIGFVIAILVESGVGGPDQFLWPLAGILVVWVIFLRPCVELTQAGVVMRNLVRDVRFSWPSIELIEQRWNLKIYGERGVGYGSWAIAAQRPQRAGRANSANSGPNMLRLGPAPAPVDEGNPQSVMRVRRGSAAAVAAAIETGRRDYADAVERDAAYKVDVTQTAEPAWQAITALVVAAVCVVVAIVA